LCHEGVSFISFQIDFIFIGQARLSPAASFRVMPAGTAPYLQAQVVPIKIDVTIQIDKISI
jgi:hypothetical protein